MKAKVDNVSLRLKINGIGWAVMACLFIALSAESEEEP